MDIIISAGLLGLIWVCVKAVDCVAHHGSERWGDEHPLLGRFN